mmetsp:Transcript_5808/g.4399  ORF Transcript_5808/g.4399 Transcript_5808/m.4399 type:complete len:80 (-) Transcript_5808:260-499(-)
MKVDIGEESLRQICSGIKGKVHENALYGMNLAIFANIKPRKVLGILSQGMILCAQSEDEQTVEPLICPKECKVGERIRY